MTVFVILSSPGPQMAFAANVVDEKATGEEKSEARLLRKQNYSGDASADGLLPASAEENHKSTLLRGRAFTDENNVVTMKRQLLAPLQNIALGGVASQSTTCHRGDPSRAIDGNTNGNYHRKSTTHTCRNSGDSWWKVDLPGNDFVINKIVVWNRSDCCSDRLSGSVVEILNEAEEVVGSYDIVTSDGIEKFEFNDIEVPSASGVRLRLPGNTPLSLTEVEVFAPLENLAVNGVASQSSKCFGGEASRAIDGDNNGSWSARSVTHTCKVSSGSWWKVDLPGDDYTIKKIVVWNRTDSCCTNRLSGSIVELLNSDGAAIAIYDIGESSAGIEKFEFDMDVFGISSVRIQQPNNKYLSLAEVEVFGTAAIAGRSPDLGLRFSKVNYLGGSPPSGTPDILPLSSDNFPMSESDYSILSNHTNGASIVYHNNDPGLDMETVDLINLLGGLPSHPSSDPENEFWSEFGEVVDYQITRRNGPLKDVSVLLPEKPELWDGMTLTDGAIAVFDEYPGFWQGKFIESLVKDGFEVDNDIIPQRAQTQFLNGIVMLADLNTWSISKVGPNSFGCKWYAGRIRPEEIAWKIFQGDVGVDDGVPQEIVDKIKSMPLSSPEDFTAYPVGCPRHPSWPAMHSAASQASFWLSVVLNLTEEQEVQAKKVDYAVAMARTIAGVHYRSDNIFGLNLGQEIVARELPEYLNRQYGSDIQTVKDKIEQKKFRWPVDFS